MHNLIRSFFVFCFLIVGQGVAAQEVILTISKGDMTSEFSLDDLDALPQERFRTTTIWTEGEVEFSGVSLSSVLAEMGDLEGVIRMVALNDYAVEMPAAEVGPSFPIVATRMNETTMKVREKGPLWIVYPYDADPAFRTETTYARSVWQLRALSIME